MKRLLALLMLLVLTAVTGCNSPPSADEKQRQETERLMQEADGQLGLPNIKNFFEKKTLKKILEMRDDPKLTTYAYTQGMNGKFIYIGRAIGYGIPYATQYTNPERAGGYTSSMYTIPQPDPNGLFSPPGAEATWVMLVNDMTNEAEIMYIEPKLVIVQSKLPKRIVEEWSLPPNY